MEAKKDEAEFEGALE